MSRCPGLHCEGCGKGKLSAGGVLLLTGGIIYLANRQKIDHAADDVIHWLLITLVILIATAVTVLATAAGIKIHAWRRRRSEVAQPSMIILPPTAAHAIPAASTQGVGEASRAAIAPAVQPAYPYLNGRASGPRQVRCPAPSRLRVR